MTDSGGRRVVIDDRDLSLSARLGHGVQPDSDCIVRQASPADCIVDRPAADCIVRQASPLDSPS